MPNDTPLLSIEQLSKSFGKLRAVDGISFAIKRGSCVGLLGPNGAGKTTTVEMLEGIKQPGSGTILYKGKPLDADFRQEAGIMFQSTALPDFITAYETLKMFRDLYPRSIPIEQLVQACSLQEFLDRDAKRLSGGQRQRLLLAIALINDPEIVFLDEPTTGLDPQARRNFWKLIREIGGRGKTVVLTTHYMEEAYELCDEILIMDHGKIIAEGTPDSLLAKHFNDVVVQLPAVDLPEDFDSKGMEVLRANGSVEILTSDVNAAIEALMASHVSLKNLKVRQRTLEDLFLELTGKELRDES
ncbi:MAG: ABC transporter ATP-binding protein [Acidithiobacillales bacterium SG8_45]|jgi:ABC-2 type transport system ATP-binding protein|nr:MAG: ABC transporter ATP-binding protein [Acidithiobacillales bacterium SG8_45]